MDRHEQNCKAMKETCGWTANHSLAEQFY